MTPEPGDAAPSRDLSGHPGVRSVMDTLALHHVTPEVRHLPLAVRTAKAAAEALGVTPAEIANSLVFVSTTHDGEVQPLLVLASGGHRVDIDKVAALAGFASVEQADPDVRARAHRVRDRRRRPGRPPRSTSAPSSTSPSGATPRSGPPPGTATRCSRRPTTS